MKTIQIKLGDHWRTAEACPGFHWRGSAFLAGQLLIQPQQVADCLLMSETGPENWGRRLQGLNGFFALILETSTQVIAAVDRVRSYPLFYGKGRQGFYLSDDAEWIRQQVGDREMDPIARDEFQLTGYVTGSDTLYPRVSQLQAGELLHIDLSTLGTDISNTSNTSNTLNAYPCTHRYFRFSHAEPAQWDETALKKTLVQVSHACIERLMRYADGRQLVIPLSGGYDSRLIATLLCKAGYRNIRTFTYGSQGNREAQYSRQVAQALQLPWHFVEYSAAAWRHVWDTEQGRRYQIWASGWSSIPHIQDWLAVRMLRHAGHVADDCLFVPGHSGDFVAGSHIPAEVFHNVAITPALLVDKILRQHYSRSTGHSGPRPQAAIWSARILERTEATRVSLPTELADAFEKWDWQERQAKFICNAVRVYEFFGYDWWMPLWDTEFVAFWQTVPLALRRDRSWYLTYVQEEYSRMTGTDTLHNASDPGMLERAARSLLQRVPPRLKDMLKALGQSLISAQSENSYALSHLSASEIKSLRRHGYRGDDMLVHEFLRQADVLASMT